MNRLTTPTATSQVPDAAGRFGQFGGRYVPETLVSALDQLQTQYQLAQADPDFRRELDGLLSSYVGRPSPALFCPPAD